MQTFITGFTISLSLILAIGAQNAFVLKQGLKGQHVFTVVLICAFSDAILISLGVSGFYLLLQYAPWVEGVARYGGAAFLLLYGALSFYSAFNKTHGLTPAQTGNDQSLGEVILVCLGFTWLNPHVYLDTVVLIGSISSQYSEQLLVFSFGAILASFVFFFTLGYGAALLRPVFTRPLAWKVLEALIGLVMWSIALNLVIAG
jgi:L-lysine exporter family protein LysE/ArgO